MRLVARSVIAVLAVAGSAISTLSLLEMYGVVPESQWSLSAIGQSPLFVLLITTPVAASLLVWLLHGWARALAAVALAPAAAALLLYLALAAFPYLHSEALSLAGFILVEIVLPLTAIPIAVAAAALIFQEIAGCWRTKRAEPQAS